MRNSVTDTGTEELAHMEMISAIVHQLTRNLTPEQIIEGGFAPYFVDHTTGIYPQAASGMPWTAASIQSTGDPISDLFEDLAADAAFLKQQTFYMSRYQALLYFSINTQKKKEVNQASFFHCNYNFISAGLLNLSCYVILYSKRLV